MKLIQIKSNHFIVIDDSEIKEGDWVIDKHNTVYKQLTDKIFENFTGVKKITHSTEPLDIKVTDDGIYLPDWSKIKALSPRTVKELIGEVDVEKKAFELYESLNKEYFSGGQKAQLPQTNRERQSVCDGFIIGYNQALEDNKEKKYTEEDIHKALSWGYHAAKDESKGISSSGYGTRFIQSLQPKTEWEVEIIDGKLKLK